MFIFFCIFAIVSNNYCCLAKVIRIEQGCINGTTLKSRDGILFHAFYGIPYAAPPVGSLRFEPPKSPPSWNGIREATQKPPVCLQVSSSIPGYRKAVFNGEEDCLYINVFTRETKPPKPLPVLVHLHGGGFRSGSGDTYGPHVFMDKPIVMVSFNNRLGFFGYFSSGNSTLPGNYGLKDQVLALQWVRKNINHFGGDPNSVTLLGHNSGATCAHLHTISSRSRGLFHRVIIESGNALKYFVQDSWEDTKENFLEALRRTNCSATRSTESVMCLKALSGDYLNKIMNTIPAKNKFEIKYQPVIEQKDTPSAFLTSDDHYRNPYVPAIIGFNSAEGLNEATSKAIQLVGDIFRAIRMMDLISSYPGVRYFYVYDYTNAVTMTRELFNDSASSFGINGAGHSDELLSLFSTKVSDKLTMADRKLSEQMVTYWVNFMHSGNPNKPEGKNTEWKPTNGNFEHLHITSTGFNMKSEPLAGRYEFWTNLSMKLSKT